MSTKTETKKTYCRVCHAACPMEIEVRNGKPVSVIGDTSNPLYSGYTCLKGRQIIHHYDHPGRLKHALKKRVDGSFSEISLTQALDEIAEKIQQHIEQNGPRSVAAYCGTFAAHASAAAPTTRAFLDGIGSESYYSLMTIDQAAKGVAMTRFGNWAGGIRGFEESDVLMFIGSNALVSLGAPPGGIPIHNASRRFQDLIKRGCTVICVDPRFTEVARRSKYFLQIKPGEDPTLLAGMIRLIFDEGLQDQHFCENHIEGLDAFLKAIDDFTPDYVCKRCDIDKTLFVEASRAFANGKVGRAGTGTGPDMAQRSNLSEHLVLVLNAVLGRYAKEGEQSAYPKMLHPEPPRKAQVIPANPAFGKGPKSRVRGLGQVLGEMPTGALPDEILEPGEGQIKALFNVGGNPLTAWPDQFRTKRALEHLDLLVSIDIRMSETCQLSDYVLPAKMCLEREDAAILHDKFGVFETPYVAYTEAVCDVLGDATNDWEYFWEIAKRIGSELPMPGGKVPMDVKPASTFEILKLATGKGSRANFDELKGYDGGKIFESIDLTVQAADPDANAKLQASPQGICEELREVREENLDENWQRTQDQGYSHLLVSRRLKDFHNSNGRSFDAIRKKGTTNFAYIHPDDLQNAGVQSGDLIEISGKHGSIVGVAEASTQIKHGVVSMSHGWGGIPGEENEVREVGSATTRLQATDKEFDPIHGMPRQSAIPVNIRALS